MILKSEKKRVVYSDGETTENRMLEIAKAFPEDSSQEYISDCSEYTVNNTFSSVRQNILNWYSFKKDSSILEIGAGMGALTGLLCDRAKRVVSVEMSSSRAEVIKARYPKRKNLEIIDEDISEWGSEEKFDYVVFIGVLEYAGVFSNTDNPYEKFLENAKRFLKHDGTLLFAIENKFGLKYWVGGSEDHLQKPFVGLQGYEQEGTPKTFSKYELEKMLENVGLPNSKFYYVFPDYKFPEIITTDERKPNYVGLKKVSFTYSRNSILTVNEKKLYKDIIENDVLDFFANSFLVEAKADESKCHNVIYVSARGETKKEYRVCTIIYDDNTLKKVPMHNAALAHIEKILENTEYLRLKGIHVLGYEKTGDCLSCKLYKGVSAQDYFENILKSNERQKLYDFIELFRKELLKTSEQIFGVSVFDEMGIDISEYQIGPVLKKGFIDLTFYNSFFDNDEFIFYDQEWCFDNIPVDFMLFYSIKSAYSRIQSDTKIKLQEIWDYLKITRNLELYEKVEAYLWSKILYRQTDFYGEDGYCNRYDESMTLDAKIENFISTISLKDNLIDKLKQEIQKQLTEKSEVEKTLSSSIDELKRLNTEQEQEIKDLRQEVLNKEGHIQLLLPPEREYKKIINSKMFKIMRFFCRTFDIIMIIPKFLGRNIFAFCRMMTHVNRQELKIAWGYVKNEGLIGAYRHLMRDYHKGEIQPIHVEVEDKVCDEIKDIQSYNIIELPAYDKPLVSIIIPAYNQFTYTYYCIKSIAENSGDVAYEVILADDCSNDLTTQIADVVKNLIIARTEQNLLFLRNCNQAAKYAKGKYILFLNNDTQVQKDWLRPLAALCESDTTIGMTGSKLVYADGTLQEAGGIIWKDGSGWNYGRNDDAMKPEYNYVRDVDYISGAAIMIRRSLWESLGGFDERFAPAYCEDSDLAFMVRKAGYRVVYQPASVVVHYEGKSNGTDLSSGIKKYQVENSIQMKNKWREEIKNQYAVGQCVFKARERSRDKKVILVIDHYVPHFDKDAGSRTIYQYIKMFIQKGYSVKFIGDNFYQHEPYTSLLQQMGVEVLYGPWYAQHWQEWILENKEYIDFAFLNRPHITIKYIDFLKDNTNIKCLYYCLDLHFLRLQREYELTGDKTKLEEAENWKKQELYIMRKADMNYSISDFEVKEIQKMDPQIRIKAMPCYAYETFPENKEPDYSEKEGIMFVGGFVHPPNEDAVLWFAKEIYPRIREKIQAPFYVVGSNPTDKIKELDGNGIIVKGFVSDEELEKMYNSCRMVAIPLRFGAGVKGKVVEALYYGTPMITTSVGAEGIGGIKDIVEIEDDAEHFAEKAVKLYQDTNLLAATSVKYREFAKEKFSIQAAWDALSEDFQ